MDEKAVAPVVAHIAGLCVSNMDYGGGKKKRVSGPHPDMTTFERKAYCCQGLQGLKERWARGFGRAGSRSHVEILFSKGEHEREWNRQDKDDTDLTRLGRDNHRRDGQGG